MTLNKKIMKTNIYRLILLTSVLFFTKISFGQDIKINVDVDNPVFEIQPTMWGLFFEDINFAADGGLYAELIKNRSFEFPNPKTGWEFPGQNFFMSNLLFINRGEEFNNQRYARMELDEASGESSMVNTGFRGIGIKEGDEYRFSILASIPEAEEIAIHVELLDSNDETIGKTTINLKDKDWKEYEAIVTADKTDPKSKLKLSFEGKGTIEFDMVSLFPVNTWGKRENGLRADLVQLLADMKPGFFRFPGGCIVEGRDLSKRYQWKQTIGNVEDRKLNINRWNDENSRATPDYYQSYGLGFYEYFLLSEDIGAEPLPVINCGMACQFNTGELVSLENLDPYVQDALDLIEFANGPVNSEWGKIRAEMGHPQPFNMKYIGVGNEQWGAQYFERYAIFEKTINEKYPDIKIVSTSGPMSSGPFFDYAEKELKKYNADLVDEHYYSSPQWFYDNISRYDDYERNTYKIFVGEFAASSHQMASPENKNTWGCALAEAAFMTGLERNADVVYMASYAPLLAHVDAWQWTPDLIWFDNLTSYGTVSYYVQKLYSVNKGTHLLNMLTDGEPLKGSDGLYASAALDKEKNEIILKIVNSSDTKQDLDIALKTKKRLESNAQITVLSSTDLEAMNTLENSDNIIPTESVASLNKKNLKINVSPYSFTLIKIKSN